VSQRSDEFAMPGVGSMSRVIAVLIDEGSLPRVTPVGEVLVQFVGPLTLSARFDPGRIDATFSDYLVNRLIGSHASEITGTGR
jgi:hypothetical protein